MTAPKAPIKTRSILCPNCGGTVEIRGFQHTRSAVCINCCTVLDPTNDSVRILQKFDERFREKPLIPLGTRGKMRGTLYEVIGFMVRSIKVEEVEYPWHEYLLFNPFKGFRYLTVYNGHWNDVIPAHGLPEAATRRGRKAAKYMGEVYGHFQSAMARTLFVMGEFPWAVRVGEVTGVDDYVSPPYMLSCETGGGEINWSHGTYIEGAEIWKSFNLAGAPPAKQGVYANQPSPHKGRVGQMWGRAMALLAAWLVVLIGMSVLAANKEVFRKVYTFRGGPAGEKAFVTEIFEIPGRTSAVDVEIATNLENNWAYFNLALVNEQTGQGYDFGREISYFSGRDSDGAWTEGNKKDGVTIPRVPPGRYYLRVEPEMEAASGFAGVGQTMNYEISVLRDAPHVFWFWLALPLLLLPPIIVTIRSAAFEGQRWQESDYAPSSD